MGTRKYKIALHILYGLVYIKRGFFLIFRWIWSLLVSLNNVYKRTIGFFIFKGLFAVQRNIKKISPFKNRTWTEVLGERNILQLFLFLTILGITIPHTRLYTKEYKEIPGQRTLLYQLVGPGDEDVQFEELVLSNEIPVTSSTQSWKQGSVYSSPTNVRSNVNAGPQELSAISSGGSAITKPIIIGSSASTAEVENPSGSNRTEIVFYVVQSGDVVGQIAQKFGINVDTILWANGLTARSYIRPGDKLKILPTNGISYKIAKGDTVSKIAKKFGVDQSEVLAFNNLNKDGSGLTIGGELVIPGGKQIQVAVPRSSQVASARPSSFNQLTAPPPSVTAPAGSGYLWPVGGAGGKISQYYTWRHGGFDLATPIGTPIYAVRAGTVKASACGWNYGYGCYVQIDHGNGVETIYAHNSQLFVSVGDYVEQGQTISVSGSTGNSTGPHLHFEVHVGGKRQNPLAYIRR
jgi:LysM repeat protein